MKEKFGSFFCDYLKKKKGSLVVFSLMTGLQSLS